MNAKFGIPAVLLSTTAVGCADPLVGTWSAESITVDDNTIEIPYESGEYTLIESIEMDVDADLTGKWEQKGYDGAYSLDLQATNNGGGSYTITLSGEDSVNLSCTMSGSKVECSEEDVTVKFNKSTGKE